MSSSADLIRELQQAGWKKVRVHGSHHIFQHPDRPEAGSLSVPHPKKDLGKGLEAKIRKQAGI